MLTLRIDGRQIEEDNHLTQLPGGVQTKAVPRVRQLLGP